MLTKKHYEKIADIIKTRSGITKGIITCASMLDVVNGLADYFGDNPEFDREKFLLDCGF